MGEVFKHMGRPTCIVKSAYSRGEREEDLELAAALGVRFWLLHLSYAQCAAAQVLQRGVNGQHGGARLDSLKHALKKDMSQVRMAFSVERARGSAELEFGSACCCSELAVAFLCNRETVVARRK
jgi:hypothetical protein